MAQLFQRCIGQQSDVGIPGAVRCEPVHLDAALLEMGLRLLQFVRLACRQQQLGALAAQCFRHLQAESARAACDQCGAPGEIEEIVVRHVPVPWLMLR